MKQRITNGVLSSLVAVALFVFSVIWMFGFEPQITGYDPNYQYRADFFYGEYMRVSTKYNGDTVLVRTLTTLAYPGAKTGRLVHNRWFARQ